jgi:hypothetical protein
VPYYSETTKPILYHNYQAHIMAISIS